MRERNYKCFFVHNPCLEVPTIPGEVGQVENIDCIRSEDQEKISKRITEASTERTLLDEFRTHYTAKFQEAEYVCDDRIKQGEVVMWNSD